VNLSLLWSFGRLAKTLCVFAKSRQKGNKKEKFFLPFRAHLLASGQRPKWPIGQNVSLGRGWCSRRKNPDIIGGATSGLF
jgi:hypothetical protein